jgi:hypothetical protein
MSRKSTQKGAEQASTFAFYSPTGEILLQAARVVNTLLKAALEAAFPHFSSIAAWISQALISQ